MNRLRSEYLIYSIVLLLPTYLLRFTIFGLPLNMLDVVIVTSFIIFWLQYKSLRLDYYWKYTIGVFLILGGIAVFTAPHLNTALGLYKSLIIEPILVSIMVLILKPPLKNLLWVFGTLALFISCLGLIQYMTGYGIPAPWNIRGADFRITSMYEYPNAVGLLLAPIIAMLVAWVIHHKSHRLFFSIVIILSIAAVIASRSDGAVAALTGSVIIALLFTRWKWIAVVCSIVALSVALLWQPTRDILLFQDASGEVRLALWQGTINLLWHHPLFGAGLGGFPELYAQYKLDRHVELLLYSHNIFLDFWVQLSLGGIIWLVVTLGYFFKRVFKNLSKDSIVLLCGMIVILIYGVVDVPYFKNDLAVLFWIILTMSSIIKNKTRLN